MSLTKHENRIDELYHRIKLHEQQMQVLSELSLNVRELAVTMKGMLSEQKSQSDRITKLEKAPLARYEKAFFSVISAALGFLSAFILTLF